MGSFRDSVMSYISYYLLPCLHSMISFHFTSGRVNLFETRSVIHLAYWLLSKYSILIHPLRDSAAGRKFVCCNSQFQGFLVQLSQSILCWVITRNKEYIKTYIYYAQIIYFWAQIIRNIVWLLRFLLNISIWMESSGFFLIYVN